MKGAKNAKSVARTAGRLLQLAYGDPVLLRQIQGGLRDRGHVVLAAADGQDAIALIRAYRPDGAVLGWAMAGFHGHEVSALVKEDPETADVAVVVISARGTSEAEVRMGFERGADEFLTTPVDIRELERVLGRLASRRTSGLAGAPP